MYYCGKVHQTKERIFGPVIDEAAEFCEKANWIGIMASPLTAEVLDRAASIDKYSNDWFKTFIEYDIPLNEKNAQGKDIEGRRKAWALLWTTGKSWLDDNKVTGKEIEKILNHEYEQASYESQVARKYENTIEFLINIITLHKQKQYLVLLLQEKS